MVCLLLTDQNFVLNWGKDRCNRLTLELSVTRQNVYFSFTYNASSTALFHLVMMPSGKCSFHGCQSKGEMGEVLAACLWGRHITSLTFDWREHGLPLTTKGMGHYRATRGVWLVVTVSAGSSFLHSKVKNDFWTTGVVRSPLLCLFSI